MAGLISAYDALGNASPSGKLDLRHAGTLTGLAQQPSGSQDVGSHLFTIADRRYLRDFVAIGLEQTRATCLSYSQAGQAAFTADLTALPQPGSHVELVQETLLAMAQVTT